MKIQKTILDLLKIVPFIILISLLIFVVTDEIHETVLAQSRYDLPCPGSLGPYYYLVTQNPQTQNLKANACIDNTGLITWNGLLSSSATPVFGPVPPGYVFSGPGANSINAVLDGSVTGTGNGTVTSLQITPTTANDYAVFMTQADTAVSMTSPPIAPTGLVSRVTNGNVGAIFSGQISATTLQTFSSTFQASANFSSGMFLLKTNGTPVLNHNQTVSGGGIGTSTTTNTLSGANAAGSTVISLFIGSSFPSFSPQACATSDSQHNNFTQTAFVQQNNGTDNSIVAAWISNNTLGGTADVITMKCPIAYSGVWFIFDLTNMLNPALGPQVPIFQPIQNIYPASVNTLVDAPINADVTLAAAANTTIQTITATTPLVGCPCRAFISYSLYLDANTSTVQKNMDFWISDGTVTYAGVQTGQSNAASGGATSATYGGYSPVVYQNNTAVNFTLIGFEPGTGGVIIRSAPFNGSGPKSDFQITFVP